MIHDFAVTQKHVAFLVTPMITDVEGMKQGRIHFSWDSSLPTWLGIMRRGGDGKDLRWFKGPERCATHTTGCFTDGERVYVDMDMALKNQFPFIPQKDGSPYDPVAAQGHITRLSVDLAHASRPGYEMEVLYPNNGVLSRQDDRYHTVPYSVAFMRCLDATQPLDPRLAGSPFRALQRLDALRSRATPHAIFHRRRRFGRAGMLLRAALGARTRGRWLPDRRRRP